MNRVNFESILEHARRMRAQRTPEQIAADEQAAPCGNCGGHGFITVQLEEEAGGGQHTFACLCNEGAR